MIDGLLALQTKLQKKKMGAEVVVADAEGIDRTRDWVKQQSRATSRHGKKESRNGGDSWVPEDGWN